MATSDYVTRDDGSVMYWPMCTIQSCGNRMNRAANNGLCWPHQPSGKTFEEMKDELGRNKEVPTVV